LFCDRDWLDAFNASICLMSWLAAYHASLITMCYHVSQLSSFCC
jgi:hypothetical protein